MKVLHLRVKDGSSNERERKKQFKRERGRENGQMKRESGACDMSV